LIDGQEYGSSAANDFSPLNSTEYRASSRFADSFRSGTESPLGPLVTTLARIAVYDDLLSSPRIIDIEPAPIMQFIEDIAAETYERAQQLGGHLPYTVIREIAENFIHADFKDCTVSILDRGDTIRFSDHGPGIEKKQLVLQPGVTSANDAMRHYIKGVGSGFPIVSEYLAIHQGSLRIDDNAVDGVVITLSVRQRGPAVEPVGRSEDRGFEVSPGRSDGFQYTTGQPPVPSLEGSSLSTMEQGGRIALPEPMDSRSVLALQTVARLGAAGPTDLVEPLSISAATAHRLLQTLETLGLLEKTSNRKRILSNTGMALLQRLGSL